MAEYVLKGVIRPERAQLSIGSLPHARLTHAGTGRQLDVELSIVMNQITAWITTDAEWDVKDLRNAIRYYINSLVSCIAFVRGLAYEVDVVQIQSPKLGIDYVFGIDIPCITARNTNDIEANDMTNAVLMRTTGSLGIALNRCLQDLRMALSHSEDTAFYCYRGIESLRHYCNQRYGIQDEPGQWAKLTELTGKDRAYISDMKKWASTERHGSPEYYSAKENEEMLTRTWDLVEVFLRATA